MIQQDTVRLLRECNSGIQMGVKGIDDVLDKVEDEHMRSSLRECRQKHAILGDDTHTLLNRYGDDCKEPHPVAKLMSTIKTGVKLNVDRRDEAAADLITEGCNMGIKSLSRYLNQYRAADEQSREIAKKLIAIEEELVKEMRAYL